MITTNLFVIANVKQLRTKVVLEFYCLFFQTPWGVGVLNSAIFNSFHNRVEFGTILEGLQNFGGGFEHPTPLGTPLSRNTESTSRNTPTTVTASFCIAPDFLGVLLYLHAHKALSRPAVPHCRPIYGRARWACFVSFVIRVPVRQG